MTKPLTDIQRAILRAAVQHPDGFAAPPHLPPAPRLALAKALLGAGLLTRAEGSESEHPGLTWKLDGEAVLLRITDAGLRAIGAAPGSAAPEPRHGSVAEPSGQAAAAAQEATQAAAEPRDAAHTQSFNTTTSMGRLTLNVLLSFAQFEREVIGERIRDKVAASKARGMWMGGKVPLGYDVRERKLVVNAAEAARVRRVFELFAETGSGVETARRLRAEGATSKSGRSLDKGDVYKILNLRTYIGEVTHKGNVYRGEHEAVVPQDLWDRAHAILQISPRARAAQNHQHVPALLKGLIFGADGRALSPTHCRKNGRLYRYYVAQRVLKGDVAGQDAIVRRVSAAAVEGAVVDQVRALLRQPEVVVGSWLAARAEAPGLTEAETREALARLEPLWDELFPAEQARLVRALVERVTVGPAGTDIRLRVAGLAGLVRDLTAIAPEALQPA